MRIKQVHDSLSGLFQGGCIRIHDRYPVQRLMRRCDAVATGSKNHEWIANSSKINVAAWAYPQLPQLELVAHEEVLDHGCNLLAAKLVIAIPPAFEIEKALAFIVYIGKQVVVLVPE